MKNLILLLIGSFILLGCGGSSKPVPTADNPPKKEEVIVRSNESYFIEHAVNSDLVFDGEYIFNYPEWLNFERIYIQYFFYEDGKAKLSILGEKNEDYYEGTNHIKRSNKYIDKTLDAKYYFDKGSGIGYITIDDSVIAELKIDPDKDNQHYFYIQHNQTFTDMFEAIPEEGIKEVTSIGRAIFWFEKD